MTDAAKRVQLSAETRQAFEAYVQHAERALGVGSPAKLSFLRDRLDAKKADKIRRGSVLAQRSAGQEPEHIPSGLIHDWSGTAFAPGVSVQQLLALVQDYNNYKNVYQPEVVDSRLLSNDGLHFRIFLRLLKKKILTVVLDSEHDVLYSEITPDHWNCRSLTTRICEVEHAGKTQETVMPADSGFGFMWRLNSYWSFEEVDGGVWIDCRAISLSRDIPTGLGWIVEPIIRNLPRESLIHTLECTRLAALQRKEAL